MFKHWSECMEEFVYDKEEPFFNILVPTVDTTRYGYICSNLLNFRKHIYLTGASGTGKTVIVAKMLKSIEETMSCDSFPLIFSA